MPKLNQRQLAFCEAYIAGSSAAEAARRAGYSERTARSIGQRLLTNVDIKTYIDERNAEIKAANTADIDEIRRFWTSAMRDEEEKAIDRLKASELLARSQGVFLDRTENDVNMKSAFVKVYLPNNGRENEGDSENDENDSESGGN